MKWNVYTQCSPLIHLYRFHFGGCCDINTSVLILLQFDKLGEVWQERDVHIQYYIVIRDS